MNIIGEKVHHVSFGEGKVVLQEKSTIKIKFDSSEVKTFSFPESFASHICFLNAEIDAYAKQCAQQKTEAKKRNEEEVENKKAADLTARQKLNSTPKVSRGNHTKFKVEHFSSVDSFIDFYTSKLSSEISYLRTNGGKRQRLSDGKLIERRNGRFYYLFESDSELFYPDDTPIKIWTNTGSIDGTVLACEELTIAFITKVNLGDTITTIEISADPWILLAYLNDRLNEIKDSCKSPIVNSLICDKKINYNSRISKGQDRACEMAFSQPITFIWGPPGTGKTETLAKIALKHINAGNRVLMLSYSNVSVDGALKRVFKKNAQFAPGEILRYGYPRDEFLLKHEYLTSHSFTMYNHSDLAKKMTELKKVLNATLRNSPKYMSTQEQIKQIRKAFKSEEIKGVKSARFVATTVSKAIADKAVYSDDYDVVIFDEASMAFIPQIIFSASLAKKHFICMGDFSQLPPISQNSNDDSLTVDIFQYCGITQAVNLNCGHDWLCMLDIQYRMHPEIANLASRVMYKSLLKTADGIESERRSISSYSPFLNQPIGIADLSGMISVCTKTSDSSRINLLSAIISFGLALKAARRNDVGIITPYNAQSRLLRAMARDAANSDTTLKSITCATVHQFQGSEKDVIIFDAVDCYLQKYPGTLLTSQSNNYANRLFNVALTRARGKFVAVANKNYLFDKNLSNSLMFTKLLNQSSNSSNQTDGMGLCKEINISNSVYNWYDDTNAARAYLDDIYRAKKEIRIDVPGSVTDNVDFLKKLTSHIEKAKQNGIKVILRVKAKDCLPDFMRKHAIVNNYMFNPVTIIDSKIVWYGMPSSGFDFVSDGYIIKTKFRPKIRIEGSSTAKSIYSFLEMNKTIDQAEATNDSSSNNDTFAQFVSINKLCPDCGKPMKLKNGKGKYFLGCSSYPQCNHLEHIDVDLVEKYFSNKGYGGMKCPQCGMSLEAINGYYGVYIQCCGLSRHKFKFNEI